MRALLKEYNVGHSSSTVAAAAEAGSKKGDQPRQDQSQTSYAPDLIAGTTGAAVAPRAGVLLLLFFGLVAAGTAAGNRWRGARDRQWREWVQSIPLYCV